MTSSKEYLLVSSFSARAPYDGIEYLERKVVDEQPCLERILVAYVSELPVIFDTKRR